MTQGGSANNNETIFKINPLGMDIAENTLQNDFSIYPNPSNGMFNVKWIMEIH
jgi:hypothetical protein